MEKYFFAVMWIALIIQDDYISLCLTLLSMLHITTFVANLFLFLWDRLNNIPAIMDITTSISDFIYIIKRFECTKYSKYLQRALGNKASPKK